MREVDGQSYLTDRDRPRGNFESVSDDYFATLGLKILEGRDFTVDDYATQNKPVAIVNASFAQKALGQSKRDWSPGSHFQSRAAATVANDRRHCSRHTLMQGPVRSADGSRRLLHAAPRGVARHSILHDRCSRAAPDNAPIRWDRRLAELWRS